MKGDKKQKAIALRKAGKTYSEILAVVPVAKSTLSEWFKSVQLAKPQIQRITQKRLDAALRGAHSKRNRRISEVSKLLQEGSESIGTLSVRELWLIGIALYWAEGSKQNIRSLSSGMIFSNSDYKMLLVYLRWLQILGIDKTDIYFELYVHENRKDDIKEFKKWWAAKLSITPEKLNKVYFKQGNPKTRRLHVGDLYHGLIRIRVNNSTTLNRQVAGWIEGIVTNLGDRLMVGQLPLKQ